ncbi:NAD(P)-dependent oxidoreductase [Paenibacillus filicis]|uniref:NAD(P)-dependent oxidoreductase n=1 Tax=Paenibacillus gyeongsangnamensis TaxID=3388067 RepID=A0ABT4Q9G0_9BACL|nr:NAD(P)-dependent oxidoreductase [Paenibacillus filicis]MCZ8513512.1 NAD(P)-dependent oxidoreductase [Paenibacillus filicis]
MNIGFIGLGTMGRPMAEHLHRAGYTLSVYNRSRSKAEGWQGAAPVRIAESPLEVAQQSDIVFTMLTDDAAVEEVYLGAEGIAAACKAVDEGDGAARKPRIVADCSTISPVTSKKLAEILAGYGVRMLDAPVTGSEPQAIEGVLTFIVGGPKEAYEQCLPLFDKMGKKAVYMGASGAGTNAKLANNMLVAANLMALSESLMMIRQAGEDPELFLEVVAGGGARSGMAEMKGPKIVNRDFSAQFMTQLMHKDLKLAERLAESLQVPVPVLASVKQMFQIACNSGWGAEDMSAVAKCYETWTGTLIGNSAEKS